jgi:hypothetical protein
MTELNLRQVIENLKLLVKDTFSSCIYMIGIGAITLLLILIAPNSDLEKNASNFLKQLSGNVHLIWIFTLVLTVFLFLGAVFRLVELAKKSPPICSEWLVTTGTKGFIDFVIPLAALSFSMGFVALAALLGGLAFPGVSYLLALGLLILVPIILLLFVAIILVHGHCFILFQPQPSKQKYVFIPVILGLLIALWLFFIQLSELLKH